MNWQKFVDDSLLGTGQVAKASIHGIDGSRYAASAGFVVLPSEAQAIINAISKDPAPLYLKGVPLGRTRFLIQRVDPGHAIHCCQGNEGIVAVKTNKCLLIGGYTERTQAGFCCAVIEKMSEYFKIHGF